MVPKYISVDLPNEVEKRIMRALKIIGGLLLVSVGN